MHQQPVGLVGQWVDVLQRAQGEPGADDAGDLERHRLPRRQVIEACRDDPLNRVGDGRAVEGLPTRRRTEQAVVDHDPTGVAHGVGELLDEERVALGALPDEHGDRRCQLGGSGPLRCQRHRILRGEWRETQPGGLDGQDPLRVGRDLLGRAHGHQQQHGRNFAPNLGQ